MNDIMELFLNEKVAVTFETEEAYDEFMKECDEHNLRWSSGSKPSSLDNYRENYTYDYLEGELLMGSSRIDRTITIG